MGSQRSDTTERLHFHFSLSCIGEGNGNPLQCPCLENPRDGGAWWAAIYGVTWSWTRLKRLCNSSSSRALNQKSTECSPWATSCPLSLYCLQDKTFFTFLNDQKKKKIKRRIRFNSMWKTYTVQISVPITEITLGHSHSYPFIYSLRLPSHCNSKAE